MMKVLQQAPLAPPGGFVAVLAALRPQRSWLPQGPWSSVDSCRRTALVHFSSLAPGSLRFRRFRYEFHREWRSRAGFSAGQETQCGAFQRQPRIQFAKIAQLVKR
jgi:hypothetical protein